MRQFLCLWALISVGLIATFFISALFNDKPLYREDVGFGAVLVTIPLVILGAFVLSFLSALLATIFVKKTTDAKEAVRRDKSKACE